MVAFPNSEIEPTFLNGGIMPNNSNRNHDDSLVNDINTRKVRDEAFTIPRVTMLLYNRDIYTVKFDSIDGIDDKKLSVDINPEPTVVKKVAAGLKALNDKSEKKDVPDGVNGNGSVSSSSSIVTISSVAVSDPDPNFHKELSGQGDKRDIRNEKWYHTILQVSVPFLIAGMGTIGAGRVLADTKLLPAFIEVPQLLILTTALQGLKGNLDMCLASRLCTQVNLGNMKSRREIIKMIIGNIALVQIQAIVAAACLSVFGMVVGTFNGNVFDWNSALLLAVSCMCTATSSCFILDFIMIAVIMLSYRFKMNPDNLATPLAASIGDVVSISILSAIASEFFVRMNEGFIWILYIVLGVFIMLLPIWTVIVLKNKYTKSVLRTGWIPILSALLISGGGGIVLEKMITEYPGSEVFQPVINGIGGNLVSVQASRMSTMLHQSSIMGILPPHGKIWVTPLTALFVGCPYAKTARLLIAMAIPGQLMFVFIANALNPGDCMIHAYFVISYIVVSVVQTALGDLSGSLLLALAFLFIYSINRPYCIE
ncbi:solute carrier family 41 member 3-like [Pogonomyrmex barbatus]|uniref:Solute carrier family 41 member 3-like n=1 Tax=Pogonomyrmex barbatus TaxID=144034 RepID=A0A6I9W6V3_9HYME|nr:solute carrier family 41 member 3-like [Pogonomyrmex barbatus]